MLLKTKSWEMHSGAKHSCFSEDTDTPNTVEVHLHVRIAVRVAEISQMRPPGRIFGVSFHNNRILVQGIGQRESGLGFLPRVQVVWLFTPQPVGKRTPDI